jgi:signal peptidase I
MLKRLGSFFLDILEVIVFAIAIFLFLYLLVFQPHKIKGASMDPNFQDGEFLLTDKVTYRFRSPQRGDVIVFKAPLAEGEEYIKRIIGLPGETVSIRNNEIYINDKAIKEKYIGPFIVTDGNAFLPEGATVTVPAESYFVLGDNRSHSSDSRAWGFVPKKDINGRAWFIYYPFNKLGVVQAYSYAQ